ncbi:hypothetical protein, partial [Phytopseudomonas dryadis]|uniref:hypothetical protein n=1 Tax=Phytopseudomonas dryadis TaxID=2487520 RepID=UPI001A955B38
HELLDSIVKERLVEPFVSTEARILQQPHFLSSYFEELLLSSQPLAAPDQTTFSPAGGAFYSVTNRCQPPHHHLRSNPIEPPTEPLEPPCQRRRILLEFAVRATLIFF